jgi:Flp pilus assembly protein TadG
LAEFAIVFPVLMLIVGAIVQFGVIFWGQNTLTQVVRDTGRWAATQKQCSNAAAVITTANAIAAQSSLIGYTTNQWTAADVTVTWPPAANGTDPCPPTNNQEVRFITVTIRHHVPVFFPWIPGDGWISSSTEYRMEPAP